jgi:hypothetical protein
MTVCGCALCERVQSVKHLINHDYLVLEIRPGDTREDRFFISAQKQNGEKPGIHIASVKLEEKASVLHEGVLHYSINCNKKIPLKTLIEILKEGDAHYNLRDANCWDYATAATKRVLKECAHLPGTSEEEKIRLEKEHYDLEANLATSKLFSTFKFLFETLFPGSAAGSAGEVCSIL